MGKERKSLFHQNLLSCTVHQEDTDNSVFDVVNVPSFFPQGKSYFLIRGSDLLRQESNLNIEILDSENIPIYYEIPIYLEASSRAISVFIYEDTAAGPGKLIITGELKDVPKDWKGLHNIRYVQDINIMPQARNQESIKFKNTPSAIISEGLSTRASYTPARLTLSSISTGYIISKLPTVTTKKPSKGITKRVIDVDESRVPTYEIEFTDVETNKNFVGGKIYVETPVIHVSPFNLQYYQTASYTASIVAIKNSNTVLVDPTFKALNTLNNYYEPLVFNQSSYRLDYMTSETGSNTIFTSSYAKIELKNLTTFSGKVNSVTVNKSSIYTRNDFEFVGNYPIKPTELLSIETNNVPMYIGQFESASMLTHWISSSLLGNSFTSTQPTASIDKNYLFNSVKLYGGNYTSSFKFFPSLSLSFPAEHEYSLNAKFKTRLQPVGSTAIESSSLFIYVSGSAFYHTILDDQIGRKIGELTSNIDRTFDEKEFNFTTDKDGTGNIVFVVNSGEWYISEISLMSAYDVGFNPDATTLYIPTNNEIRNDVVNFKLEYLNERGELAYESTVLDTPVTLRGSPTYILGSENLITGSLNIGNSLVRGFEITGDNGTFLKTHGYQGFNNATSSNGPGGILLYSGSVLGGSGDNYRGMGLELHPGGGKSGSLRYRSDDSGSFLEISGSIYAIDGHFSGFLEAATGSIGGWLIGSDFISSSGGSMSLGATGSIVTPYFKVSPQGNLTASNALLSGSIYADSGRIAGLMYVGNTVTMSGALSGSITVGAPNNDRIIIDGESRTIKFYSDATNFAYINGFSDGTYSYINANGSLYGTGIFLIGTTNASGGWTEARFYSADNEFQVRGRVTPGGNYDYISLNYTLNTNLMKINFYSDTNLYRSTANVLKTDDNLEVALDIYQDDIVYPYITIAGSTSTRTITAKCRKFDDNDSANNHMLLHYWFSNTDFGAAETLSGSLAFTPTVTVGTNFSAISLSTLNHAQTDNNETFTLSLTKDVAAISDAHTFYFMTEVQGILYGTSFTILVEP